MRQVIPESPKQAIEKVPAQEVSKAGNTIFVARKKDMPAWKGIVTRHRWDGTSCYELRSLGDGTTEGHCFTRGNKWRVTEASQLDMFLRNLIFDGWEVMECKDWKEAFTWLELI